LWRRIAVTPLNGVKVVELTGVVAGPLATRILAEQGAEVRKIEAPDGDRAALSAPIASPATQPVPPAETAR
jgi:crotonobetainyl-CoA:carnitine CoA-transferase CaiB-like acyl-CoA transferase